VKDAVEAGVVDGTTPGAAALVITPTGSVVHCAGRLHREAHAGAIDEDTVWDLASLTKLLSTTLLAARAVDEHKLALEETPWPQWPGVTVEHVLRHESGLPNWRPLYAEARDRGVAGLREGKSIVVAAAHAVKTEAAPRERTLYSDIGFIALGALLEQRLGDGLDALFHREAAERFGDSGLRFVRLDIDGYHPALPKVAPTERCPWRRRAMQGQVHDENAFAMGGVAGHAGLFGSLRDVEKAARFFLGPMTPTLRAFATVPSGSLDRRPVGFDRATPTGSTGGALSEASVGHLAFTGCSLWIDPVGACAYVLLTNRIHESRAGPEKILALRRRFHRAARPH
jgi:CubicO group peptidase (beta-lactamase class C family)